MIPKDVHRLRCAAVIAITTLGVGGAQAAQPARASNAALAQAYDQNYATSDLQYAAMKTAVGGGDKKTQALLPDWRGLWTHNFEAPPFFTFGEGTQSDLTLTPEYGRSTAELTPEYQAKFDKKKEDLRKGIEWDQLSDCLPAGFPRWLTEPFLREFIVTPEQTWLITEQQSEVRRVYTDGRPHVAEDEAYPLWEGDSIGFWSGDTLIIHTNHLKPGQYQRGQPDYSDQTSAVETVHKTGPDKFEVKITVYDPKSLTKPYRSTFVYDRVKDPLRINMWSCNENNNVVKTGTGGSDFVLPGETGYKDPNTIGQAPAKQ